MTYTVYATRTLTENVSLEVDANSEEEAETIADQSNEWKCDDSDVTLEIGLIEPNGTEEDDEDDEDEE